MRRKRGQKKERTNKNQTRPVFFLVDWSAHHQHSPCKTHTDEKYFQIKNHNNFTLVHKELISDENTNDPLSFYFLGKPT